LHIFPDLAGNVIGQIRLIRKTKQLLNIRWDGGEPGERHYTKTREIDERCSRAKAVGRKNVAE